MRTLSLSTSVRLLRVCPFLAQKFPSSTFKEFNNFYSASWPSSRITKPTVKTDSLYFINPPAYYSTNLKSSRPTKAKLTIEKKILTLKTAKYLMDIVNKISILYNIAKIIERDEEQKQVLKQELNSTYMELLDNISIQLSRCLPQKHACCDVGFRNKSRKTSKASLPFARKRFCPVKQLIADKLFDRIEEEILRRGIPYLDKTDFYSDTMGIGITGKGSKQLFYSVDNELVSRGVERFSNAELLDIVWCFVQEIYMNLLGVFLRQMFEAGAVFDALEKGNLKEGEISFQ
ncbi:hypothetical protein OS493_037844 [Desmophyllum pertusum]|uniref:Uncharacterized protein n=1 Tax=Desmophyllum pertusum TaxID=174260 RepID=A0A9W9ZVA9_9CNID|nr:hypothetical protein OS493_037844 [Desmophyllum pertusum]